MTPDRPTAAVPGARLLSLPDIGPAEPRVLAGVVLAGALAWTFAGVAPIGLALVLAAVFLAFVTPGIVAALWVYGEGPDGRAAALAAGPIAGYFASSAVLLALWVAGVRRPLLLALAPAIAIAALLPARRLRGLLAPPAFDRRDVLAVLLVLLLVPLIVGRPFARVGEPVPDGRAYRAYFTADLVWRMAVTAELRKGDVPPLNPFFQVENDLLHYYWMPHLLPAVEYRGAGAVTLESILLSLSVAVNVCFLAFLYWFARHFVRSPAAAGVACAAVLLCSSFEGTYQLFSLWLQGRPLAEVRNWNIDSITRWVLTGMPVDGLHRLLLYQPHHAIGYGLGMAALALIVQAREKGRAAVSGAAGALLAGSLLMSAFAGVMLVLMTATYQLAVLARERRGKAIFLCGAAGAVPLAGALALAQAFEYVDPAGGRGIVEVMANPLAFTRPVLSLILSFGPILPVAGIGAVLAWRADRSRAAALAIVIAVCFAFYFFVEVHGHQHVYVGWRAGHLLFIAFTPLVALALQELWRRTRLRGTAAAAAAVLALTAVPTVAIDLYNTQDIANRSEAVNFPWTLILTADELEALAWIKRTVPHDAVVQVDPLSRGVATWAYVPAFGERRMAAGLPISMTPVGKYEVESVRIRVIFEDPSPEYAHDQAVRKGVDYIFVGPPERAVFPAVEGRFDSRADLFARAFRNGSVSIYRVNRAARVDPGDRRP